MAQLDFDLDPLLAIVNRHIHIIDPGTQADFDGPLDVAFQVLAAQPVQESRPARLLGANPITSQGKKHQKMQEKSLHDSLGTDFTSAVKR
jgi:hypothetical protein